MPTFSLPIDEIPDVLELEPDIDGIDWIEDDPDLHVGPAHLYVHGSSTAVVTVEVSEAMTLDVHVPATASSVDWDLALEVVERAMEQADTVLVELICDPGDPRDPGDPADWPDRHDEPMELAELQAFCDPAWRSEQLATAVRRLRASDAIVAVPGPTRTAFLGPRVLTELTQPDGIDQVEQGRRLLDILRSVQWVSGPHDRAAALTVPSGDASMHTVAVIGPLLRYVLPPTDRLLIENGNLADDAGELLIPSTILDSLPGVRVKWLDDGNRLMEPVAEAAWPAVVAAAEQHRLPG